ncbi:MAG: Hsp33 family molecular chaperone HslO [Acidaminococcaceae bacterium]|nr:Hsp33 family molecular chaperone HslO [Acidaminococcaceae bacterium]
MNQIKEKISKGTFTGEADILTRATVGDARIYVARTTRLVRKMSLRHQTSHLATAALGRTVTGALLLAATMKNEDGVGIKIAGDGPIEGITGEAQGGTARGYVGNPNVYLPPKNGHLDVGGAVGNGTISVTRYTANAKPFTGTAELVDGEIADDLTQYLFTSEQTPSSVGLGVLVDEKGDVQAAGGWFIQALPNCSEETLEQLDKNVRNTPYISSLIDMGFTPERIIRMLGKDMDVEILDSYPLHFGCRCSRERVEGVLQTLPKKELNKLAEDPKTEVTCPYCNAKYEFSREEMLQMAQKVKK